jgi:hypothetical protein
MYAYLNITSFSKAENHGTKGFKYFTMLLASALAWKTYDDDVYLDKLQTRVVKIYPLHVKRRLQPIRHK